MIIKINHNEKYYNKQNVTKFYAAYFVRREEDELNLGICSSALIYRIEKSALTESVSSSPTIGKTRLIQVGGRCYTAPSLSPGAPRGSVLPRGLCQGQSEGVVAVVVPGFEMQPMFYPSVPNNGVAAEKPL